MPQVLVFVLFFAGVYFVLLRPQQQRVKRQRELITAIGVGDLVVTAGGLIGRVVDLTDDRLQLEIADGVVVELLRLAISRRLDESESESGFGIEGEGDGEGEGEGEEYVEDEALDGEASAVDDTEEPEGADPGLRPSGAGAPAQALRPSGAAGSGGVTEEAATPAPGQDPI